MDTNMLIVGYAPLAKGGEVRKSAELRADAYFKDLLENFNLGALHFCDYENYKSSIDQLNPILCVTFSEHTAEEIRTYRKDILLYVTYYPTEIFWRKKEKEKREKEQNRTFREIEGLLHKIKEDGEKGLSAARTFATMDYDDWYKLIKQSLMSDRPDLVKKALGTLNSNDGHSRFIWMRSHLMMDCWNAADAKGKEEFLTLGMKQYTDEGYTRQMENFTDQDGLEYRQYMFLFPDGSDLNYIRRIPIAQHNMDKWAYENLLDKYETPKSIRLLVEIGHSKKMLEKYHYGKSKP